MGELASDIASEVANARAFVVRLKIGDEATAREAFTVLFHAHYAAVLRFVQRYVVTREVAEDVVQETFVRLWERRATIDPERPFPALLFSAARNRAVNVLAHDATIRAHAERAIAQYADLAAAPRAPAADELLLADELARVAAARVAALPPRQREIYQLSRDDGLSPAEIADVLEIAPATVYVQLSKIVHALFPALNEWTNSQ